MSWTKRFDPNNSTEETDRIARLRLKIKELEKRQAELKVYIK